MKLLNREGLFGRVALGVIAGIVTIFFFTMDTMGPDPPIHAGNSAYNYSILIVMFYILFVMNFIAGIKREYEASLSYIILMVVYDLATTGLVTVLFAGVAFVSLIFGVVVSFVLTKLGFSWGNEEATSVF
jgi:hypothetical protein